MPVLTGTALITDALEEIGARAAGETLNSDDAAKGLTVLNRMIEAAPLNRGNVYTERQDFWNLVAGKQAYTIGIDPTGATTADFQIANPIEITRANIIINPGAAAPVRHPMRIFDPKQWAEKSVQLVSGLPRDLYNNGATPLSTYFLYPVPAQAYQLETYTWQQFTQLAAITDNILIPQGYLEYWVYGLAMRLFAPFGRQPSPLTANLYAEARIAVQARNAYSPRIAGDGTGSGSYNWISGLTE